MRFFAIFLFFAVSLLASFESLLQDQSERFERKGFVSEVVQERDLQIAHVILDVPKPIAQVWREIHDFESYPVRTKDIVKADVYEKSSTTTKVTFTFKGFFLSLNNSFVHRSNPSTYTMTWQLDPNKTSDMLTVSDGLWRLESLGKNRTRVYYRNALKAVDAIPDFVIGYAAGAGAKNATLWLLD